MLVYNNEKNKYVIDPHYLSIIPLRNVWNTDSTYKKEIGEAKLMWIYHMYNPHSAFRDYKADMKSYAIVQSHFPKYFLDDHEKNIRTLIAEAEAKNKDSDPLKDNLSELEVEGGDIKPKKKREYFVPKFKLYDPLDDEVIAAAASWYKDHLQQTPLWFAYGAYKDAMYNLSKIIGDPSQTPQNIKTASQELDTLPKKMETMRQQAIKDEAMTLKVTGDKNIKRGEKKETYTGGVKRRSGQQNEES